MHRRTVVKAAAATGLAALFGAVATTRAGAATQISERVFDLSIASAALGRSAPVRLILPTDFDARPTRTWPVLYLLHGAHDDYNSWTRETDIEAFTEGLGLIVAMPDGGPTGIPTKWRDGTDYETFQLAEVHAVLRSDYRASTVRAVAGVSTGGYGAIAHAARHPGAFAAAASYSGILDTTMFGVPPIVDAIVARENVAAWSLWGNPVFQYATWRDYNPRVRASALSGTPLYVSNGSGLVGRHRRPAARGPGKRPVAVRPQLHLGAEPAPHPGDDSLLLGGGHSWAYWQPEFRASWPILASALGL